MKIFEIFYDLLVFKKIDAHDAEKQLKICGERCESHSLIMCSTNFYYVPHDNILVSFANLFHEIFVSACSDQKKINTYMIVLICASFAHCFTHFTVQFNICAQHAVQVQFNS